MLRRFAIVGFTVALMLAWALPAEAAAPKRLRLDSYSLLIWAPPATPGTACDSGSQLYCGYVSLSTVFSGLNGRDRPTLYGPPYGNLVGTVHVVRVYGCQNAQGKRLKAYDTTVAADEMLNTRRALGYTIPLTGDTITPTTYSFLPDRQPGNCPAGTQGMTYSIKARGTKLELVSGWASIPDANYSAPGKAQWTGAVPAPIHAAAATA